jgi:hypothetical protein
MCPLYLRYMVRKHIQGWNSSMLQELKTTNNSYKLKTNSNSLEDHKPPPRNGQCSAANSWMGQHQLVKVSNLVDNDTMDMKKIRRCTYRRKLLSTWTISVESSTVRLGHRRISHLASRCCSSPWILLQGVDHRDDAVCLQSLKPRGSDTSSESCFDSIGYFSRLF